MASTIWFRDGKSIGWIDYFDGARALNDDDNEEEEVDGASDDDGQDAEENVDEMRRKQMVPQAMTVKVQRRMRKINTKKTKMLMGITLFMNANMN
eukprot:71968_1